MKMDETRGGGSPPDSTLCAQVLEVLPLRIREPGRALYPLEGGGGALAADALAAHLLTCPSCAADAEFLATLDAARPEPPEGLAARIVARVLTEEGGVVHLPDAEHAKVIPFPPATRRRGPAGVRWWASTSAAAAVLVTALGVGLVSRGTTAPQEDGFLAYLEETAEGWWGSDWFVAGAPYLEGVSDETLAVLAAEIQP